MEIFAKMTEDGQVLSGRLATMYAKELLISGGEKELQRAEDYFTRIADGEETTPDQMKEAVCVVVRGARLRGDFLKMYRYAMKDVASEGVSEVCYELGEYYFGQGDFKEAAIWFYNAAYETQSILNIHCGSDLPLNGLGRCYEALGMKEQAKEYYEEAAKAL